jgi:hypothetical protein
MAQSAKNQTQQEQPIRRPLSREEAIAIAKKSVQQMRAQRQQKSVSGVQTQQSVKQPPTPGASNPDHTNKDGTPDKRFVENRGTDSRQPQTRPANTGGQVRQMQQAPIPGRPAAPARPGMQQPPMPNQTEHTTKDGTPDRRFAENRALPPEPKRRDSVGVHRTKNGAPDRRFLENQHLSSRQAEIERAKYILGDDEPVKG